MINLYLNVDHKFQIAPISSLSIYKLLRASLKY